jgi:uncharacterized protein YuzE
MAFALFRHGYEVHASAGGAIAFRALMCDTNTIMMLVPRISYNRDADAAYIHLREGVQVARTRNLDGVRLIDYAADGESIGIELLDMSDGVNLDRLPRRDVVARLLAEHHIPVFA